jgi:hypothetical protein
MTASSFTSVSLDPMLILVCVDEKAKILSLLHEKRQFGIRVLKQGQQAISEYFAQCEQNAEAEQRLALRYRRTPTGVPVLEGTALQQSCSVVDAHVAGDHTIFCRKSGRRRNPGRGTAALFWRRIPAHRPPDLSVCRCSHARISTGLTVYGN